MNTLILFLSSILTPIDFPIITTHDDEPVWSVYMQDGDTSIYGDKDRAIKDLIIRNNQLSNDLTKIQSVFIKNK